MSTIERPCHGCGTSLPYSMMERQLHSEWGKYVYYCKACIARMAAEQAEAERQRRARMKKSTNHVNWWDKPKHQ